MKKINVFLALKSPILFKGLESLIKSNYPSVLNLVSIHSSDEFSNMELQFEKNHEYVLVCDCAFCENFNSKMVHLLQSYPFLKVMVLIEKFNHEKIKFLFNSGVKAVMDHDIEPDDFLIMFERILHDNRSLSNNYKEEVIKSYCESNIEIFNSSEKESQSSPKEKEHYFEQFYGLTRREKEILPLICNGDNTKEISDRLFISFHTVETHRRNLLAKLDVRNTAEMVRVAILNNLV